MKTPNSEQIALVLASVSQRTISLEDIVKAAWAAGWDDSAAIYREIIELHEARMGPIGDRDE